MGLATTGGAGDEKLTYIPSIRTNYGRGSLWFRGTTIWNSLSPTVIAAEYLAKFKTSYFNFL